MQIRSRNLAIIPRESLVIRLLLLIYASIPFTDRSKDSIGAFIRQLLCGLGVWIQAPDLSILQVKQGAGNSNFSGGRF